MVCLQRRTGYDLLCGPSVVGHSTGGVPVNISLRHHWSFPRVDASPGVACLRSSGRFATCAFLDASFRLTASTFDVARCAPALFGRSRRTGGSGALGPAGASGCGTNRSRPARGEAWLSLPQTDRDSAVAAAQDALLAILERKTLGEARYRILVGPLGSALPWLLTDEVEDRY